jgi:hypothetical protein
MSPTLWGMLIRIKQTLHSVSTPQPLSSSLPHYDTTTAQLSSALGYNHFLAFFCITLVMPLYSRVAMSQFEKCLTVIELGNSTEREVKADLTLFLAQYRGLVLQAMTIRENPEAYAGDISEHFAARRKAWNETKYNRTNTVGGFPDFDAVLSELAGTRLPPPCACLTCCDIIRHCKLFPETAWVIRRVLEIDEERWGNRIRSILNDQPRHAEPAMPDLASLLDIRNGGEAYPPLAEALLLFCKDAPTPTDVSELREAFNLLGLAVSATIDYCLSQPQQNNRVAATVNTRLIEHFGLLIADPLSPLPASLRRKLVGVDLRSLFYLLMRDVGDFLAEENASFSVLSWSLWKKVAGGIRNSPLLAPYRTFFMDALTLCAPLAEYSRMSFFPTDPDTQEAYDEPYVLLDPDLPLNTNYFHSRHVYFRYPEEFFPADFNHPPVFRDVEFEPVPGTELDPLNYGIELKQEDAQGDCSICRDALSEQKSVAFECKHAVHYECAVFLINGIDGYCNKCPECRHKICPKRQKRIKQEE